MAYFKINNIDFSMCVNQLSIQKITNYAAQVNAEGNTVVDYINSKRIITVGIIPLSGEDMATLQTAISNFSVNISFQNPETNAVEENVTCIIPDDSVSYYTIQAGKVLFNAFTLVFTEL